MQREHSITRSSGMPRDWSILGSLKETQGVLRLHDLNHDPRWVGFANNQPKRQ